MTDERREELIRLAEMSIRKGFSESQTVALIEAENGISSEEEAKDIVTLAGSRIIS